MNLRKTKIWPLVAMLAFGFIACDGNGSDGSQSEATATAEPPPAGPSEYVATLCTTMTDWLTELQELQAQVQATVQPGAEPADAQEALRTFFDNAITATDDLLGAVEEVGTPAVNGGETIHSEITARFQEVRAALEQGRAEVDDLPIDDRQAFITEAADLRESFQSQLEAIGNALAQLSQPELDAAAAEEPSCTGLSPTGG